MAASRRIGPKVRKVAVNALVCAFSIALAFLLAETIARLFFNVRNVGPSFSEYDPIYGKRLKANLRTIRITPEFRMTFATNSLGHRGPEHDRFPSGGMLFFGDSFTMGYGVNDGEEYPQLVAHALSGGPDAPPIVNLGIGDNGCGRWLIFVNTELKRYQPRLIIFQINPTDFGDDWREGLYGFGADGELVSRPPRKETMARSIQSLIDSVPGLAYSHLIAATRQLARDDFPSEGEAPRAALERAALTLAIVREMLTVCTHENVYVLGILNSMPPGLAAQFETLFRAHGFATIAIPSREENPDLYYTIDGHWNAQGHRLTADAILKWLETHPERLDAPRDPNADTPGA